MADEKQKKTKVTLAVPMSEADLGQPAAKAGDVVEVDADVAERWIAAGIATAGDKPAEKPAEPADEPPDKPASGPTGRRSS